MALNPLVRKLGVAGESIWRRIPLESRRHPRLRTVGKVIHTLSTRFSERRQSDSTWFLRNLPLLYTIRDLVSVSDRAEPLRLCTVGCSSGAEVYSILWMLRKAQPNRPIVPVGIDQSATVIEKAESGRYLREGPELRDLDEELLRELFDNAGSEWKIKAWIAEGVRWLIADACDPGMSKELGAQDVLLANNFLIHMDKRAAESCLSNLVNLVRPGGLLVCRGVDLDVRQKVVRKLRLEPIATRIEEIHEANPQRDAPRDWPWRYWSLEPLDKTRKDWVERYATIFRIPLPN